MMRRASTHDAVALNLERGRSRTAISVALIATAVLELLPLAALAHGGGLDSYGCHHDRKHGGYHCHRGPLAGRSFSSKAEAMRALDSAVDQRKTPTRVDRQPSHGTAR